MSHIPGVLVVLGENELDRPYFGVGETVHIANVQAKPVPGEAGSYFVTWHQRGEGEDEGYQFRSYRVGPTGPPQAEFAGNKVKGTPPTPDAIPVEAVSLVPPVILTDLPENPDLLPPPEEN